jgi:Cu/Ag efflux protein CusF
MNVGRSTIALAISAILIGAAPLVARAQQATEEVTSAPGTVQASGTVKMTASVLSIDMGSRDVLLMDTQGKLHTVNVSDQARNLDQLRVGDKVTAEYTEAISLQLKKRGTAGGPPVSEAAAMVRSPKGAKPGGAVGRKVTAIATVTAVNTQKQFVTLRGPLGNEFDVQVLDPAQLKAVKMGDEVEVVYTEALAISVQSTPISK